MENDQPPIKRSKSPDGPDGANKQKLNLTDITPHCILKIFEHLDVIDLSIIADTNKELRTLAQDHFRLKCENVQMNSNTIYKSGRSKIKQQTSKIFRNFGELISNLSITNIGCATRFIFELAGKYCKPTTLTHLHLRWMVVDEFIMATLNPFFEDLQILKITFCTIQNMVVFPVTFRRLTSLEMELGKNLDEFLFEKVIRNNFPQLETFCVSGQSDVNHDDFCSFIRRHPNLKSLSIEDSPLTGETIQFVGQTLTQLEHFELKGNNQRNEAEFRQALVSFGSVTTLKKLILDCNHLAVDNLFETFVANNIGIEHLHLIHVNLNEQTQMHLKRLNTIRTLIFKFTDHPNTKQYISIAEDLPLLSEFHLACRDPRKHVSGESFNTLLLKSRELSVLQIESLDFTINNREYSNMLNIIKNRYNAFGLEIRLWKVSGQVDVRNDEIKANEKWIRFVEL